MAKSEKVYCWRDRELGLNCYCPPNHSGPCMSNARWNGDCPSCDGFMVIRQDGRSGKYFWGCSKFPLCRGTRELASNPSKVSKEKDIKKESSMQKSPYTSTSTSKPGFFQEGKLYIVRKPRNSERSYTIGSFVYNWVPEMDQFTNTIHRCSRAKNGVGWLNDTHDYAFVREWCEGPFDSLKEAVEARDGKEVQTSKPIREAVNEVIAHSGGKSFTISDIHVDENGKIEYHLKDTKTSVTSVVSNEDSIKDKADAIFGRWSVPAYSTSGIFAKEKAGNPKIDGRFNPLAQDEDICIPVRSDGFAKVEVLRDPIDERYEKEIDKIFEDYHDRRQREADLNKRVEKELSPKKSRSKLKLIMLGLSLVGVAAASGFYFLPIL